MDTKYDEVMKKIDDVQFHRLYGYTKTAMKVTAGILRKAYAAKHRRRRRHAKLDAANMLLLACKYWRGYVTFLSLAAGFGAAESTAHDITVWVEDVLIKSGRFGLPGKKHFEQAKTLR